MKPYKYTQVQQLKETDRPKRLEFCNFVLDRNREDETWYKRIIFSDEATLHLNGTINTHNCFYYAFHNENRTMEKPMKSNGVTVWVMVPYDGRFRQRIQYETMNADRYAEVLNDIVIPTMKTMRYRHHYFQQDGAPPHWALNVRQLLNDNIPGRWIGRSGTIAWPPRSPDLTVNDFWLWGYLRDQVYREPRPQTLQELATKCENVLDNIDHQTVQNSFVNFLKRCELCVDHEGSHIEQFCK